jgi:hypothetical protein
MSADSLGLTPGGLGVVEASLSIALIAGVTDHKAIASVLVYRFLFLAGHDWRLVCTGGPHERTPEFVSWSESQNCVDHITG